MAMTYHIKRYLHGFISINVFIDLKKKDTKLLKPNHNFSNYD